MDHLGIAFEFFEARLPLALVIDDPLREPDRALDMQVRIVQLLAKIGQLAAPFDKGPQVANPRLDSLEPRLSGDAVLLVDRQLLPPDGAGVQTDPKRSRI